MMARSAARLRSDAQRRSRTSVTTSATKISANAAAVNAPSTTARVSVPVPVLITTRYAAPAARASVIRSAATTNRAPSAAGSVRRTIARAWATTTTITNCTGVAARTSTITTANDSGSGARPAGRSSTSSPITHAAVSTARSATVEPDVKIAAAMPAAVPAIAIATMRADRLISPCPSHRAHPALLAVARGRGRRARPSRCRRPAAAWRSRRPRPRAQNRTARHGASMAPISASTHVSSNWMPALSRSSPNATSWVRARRYARVEVMASKASATVTIRASIGVSGFGAAALLRLGLEAGRRPGRGSRSGGAARPRRARAGACARTPPR